MARNSTLDDSHINRIECGATANQKAISSLAAEAAFIGSMPGWDRLATMEHRAAASQRKVSIPTPGQTSFTSHILPTNEVRQFRNALSAESGSGGQFTSPSGWIADIERAMGNYPLLRLATVERRPGNPIRQSTIDVTTAEATEISENRTQSTVTPTFGLTEVRLRTFQARLIVPGELPQDAPDLLAQVPSIVGDLLGAGEHRSFLNKPAVGLIAQAYSVSTVSAGVVSSDDIEDLIGAVSSAYIPNARFLMAAATWKTLRKQKDGSGARLWTSANGQRWLADFPLELTEHMPSQATGNAAVLFGDFSQFLICENDSIRFSPDTETYAEKDEVLWLGTHRTSGSLKNTGSLVAVAKLVVS